MNMGLDEGLSKFAFSFHFGFGRAAPLEMDDDKYWRSGALERAFECRNLCGGWIGRRMGCVQMAD